MNLNLSPEEFYRRRDDRTDRVTDSRDYHALLIRLVAPETTARTFSGQVQILLAANQLARWCRQIELGIPDVPLDPNLCTSTASTLQARLNDELTQADPSGQFPFADTASPETSYTLKIGSLPVCEPVNFTIDADGWHAFAGTRDRAFPCAAETQNPVGPAFAACIGVADAFKVAINADPRLRVEKTAVDLFHLRIGCPDCEQHPALASTIELGHTLMVGLGSVGSAVAYLMRMLPVQGRLTLIDHDAVEIENLNRSPLFGVDDVGLPKVDVSAAAFSGHLDAEPFCGRFDQFIECHGRKPGDWDLVLALANEHGVRRQIELNLPPLQIYGTTSPSWVINLHRHIPLVEDCSVCRFPPPAGEQEPAMDCSKAQIETASTGQIDAALPFLSVGAAVLTIAELIRLQAVGVPVTPSFADIDMLGPLTFINSHDRPAVLGCQCKHRNRDLHARYIENTRFSALSRVSQREG